MRGPWPRPCFAKSSLRGEQRVQVFLLRPRATWDAVGLDLCWKRKCGSLTLENATGALFTVLLVYSLLLLLSY